MNVISGWGRRKFSHNELSPDIDFREKERAYFGPGERMRWKRRLVGWTHRRMA